MGLYLHVPFCVRKCPYCSFFSVAGSRFQHAKYAQAVVAQAKSILRSGLTDGRQIESIFVGGGTPSVMESELLAVLLQQFREIFPLAAREIEVSVEVNPATVNRSDLAYLRRAGYNRISIGVQSLSDQELREIGRPHNATDAIQVITDARKAGFLNCNVDLMYGLPGQTIDSWKHTLNRLLDMQPDHLAIYELTVEEDTHFALLQQQNRLNLPNENEIMEMMSVTAASLNQAGLYRYEISNYSRPGMECSHNINYWKNGWYTGLGSGAVSYLMGTRFTAVKDIEEYCRRVANGDDWWSETEELDTEARFRETVIMGLRMTQGVSVAELTERFVQNPISYYGPILHNFVELGLIERQDDRIRLTRTGMNLANQVMAQLV